MDFFVSPHALRHAAKLLENTAANLGLLVFRRIRRQYGFQVFLATDAASMAFHVDLLPVADYRGVPYLDLESLLARRVRQGSFFYPQAADLALYLLLRHLLWGESVKHLKRIQALLLEQPKEAEHRFREALGTTLATQVLDAVERGDETRLATMAGLLKRTVVLRALFRNGFQTAWGFLEFVIRELAFTLRPAGLLIRRKGPLAGGKIREALDVLADGEIFFPEHTLILESTKSHRDLVRAIRNLKNYGVIVTGKGLGFLREDATVAPHPEGGLAFEFRFGQRCRFREPQDSAKLRIAAVHYLSERERRRQGRWGGP